MNRHPTAHFRPDNHVEIRFPYNKMLVEAIKLHIPASHREYCPVSKVWTVAPPYATTAAGLLRQHFPGATVHDAPPTRPLVPAARDLFAVLYLLPEAPRCVVEASYRALAKAYHPDLVPDHERPMATTKMRRINEAVAVLREWVPG